jgi:LPLT family lysophospholipid transporter-like MFS transporter
VNKYRDYLLVLSSQFVSALGDQIFLAVLIGQLGLRFHAHKIDAGQMATQNVIITSVMFVAYIFFAPLAGFLNDRYSKSGWLLGGNALKLAGVLLAFSQIWLGGTMELIGYFVMGVGACIYSPAKYGILPELLPKERLVKANGTMELLTLLAILIGPYAGARLIDTCSVPVCYMVLTGLFITSTYVSWFIEKTPNQPTLRLKDSVKEFWQCFMGLFSSKRLRNILLGTMLFWIIGAIYKMNFLSWGMEVLKLDSNTKVSLLGLWLGLGIMSGSLLAGFFYKTGDLHHSRYYGWGLAIVTGVLALVRGHLEVCVLLFVVGVLAGLFLIPLNAALQAETHQDSLGKTIATQNFGENIAMMAGGGFVLVLNGQSRTLTGLVHMPVPCLIFLTLAVFVLLAVTGLKLVKKVDA